MSRTTDRRLRLPARRELPKTRAGWILLVLLVVLALVFYLVQDAGLLDGEQRTAAPDSQLDPLLETGLAVEVEGGIAIDGQAVAAEAGALRITDRGRIGYDRDEFPHWTDPDGNGCDTRNDILARDLDEIIWAEDGCRVMIGTLVDPYTGETIEFVRGPETSPQVQIDHVIPLSAAWQGGADSWTTSEREQFANDPVNLEAVSGPENQAKGDRLPGEWLPADAGYHCVYVARITYLADRYDIAVTLQDRDAMVDIASGCRLPS